MGDEDGDGAEAARPVDERTRKGREEKGRIRDHRHRPVDLARRSALGSLEPGR